MGVWLFVGKKVGPQLRKKMLFSFRLLLLSFSHKCTPLTSTRHPCHYFHTYTIYKSKTNCTTPLATSRRQHLLKSSSEAGHIRSWLLRACSHSGGCQPAYRGRSWGVRDGGAWLSWWLQELYFSLVHFFLHFSPLPAWCSNCDNLENEKFSQIGKKSEADLQVLLIATFWGTFLEVLF